MDRKFSTDSQNTGSGTRRVSINGLTHSVLDHYSHVIANKKLRVETDLTHFSANVNQRFITNAVCRLIENAIEQSPKGGEVNITLVASARQWELEVADSAIDSPADAALGNLNETFLDEVEQVAKLHGGLVRTFNCPQGGTANALIIPHNSTFIRSA